MSTVRRMVAVNTELDRYELLVIVDGLVSSYPLPQRGEVTVGRATENDVQIVDPSVSRRHAKITVGDTIVIEDTKSSNGIIVKGRNIAESGSTTIQVGEVVEIGSAILMLQRRSELNREIRIWAHGYFEVRLEQECDRARTVSGSFGLLRVSCEEEGKRDAVHQAFARMLSAKDVVGQYSPLEYEILLPNRSPEEVFELNDSLTDSLARIGVVAKIRAISFPRDGRTVHELQAKISQASQAFEEPHIDPSIVLKAPAMRRLYAVVKRIATSDIAVLLVGETGVGKEVVADSIHRLSPRSSHPFLRLNCAALPESLLESELFGHERGAFTGAHKAKKGLLETANKGTVFLDEIGDMPYAIQVKLLRVLEERKVWPIGSVAPQLIDVRFIAATHRDLEKQIESGAFRQDLFFRLAGITLSIPPLRERLEEIAEMARIFVRRIARRQGYPSENEISPEVITLLTRYRWPGNVRELQNTIERAVVLAGSGPIRPEHLPLEKMSIKAPSSPPTPISPFYNDFIENVTGTSQAISNRTTFPPPLRDDDLSNAKKLKHQVQEIERQHIVDALNRCGGNQTRAAKELGISRRTLINRLDAYGIPRPLKY
jgi:two-component system, NtrC family, response regulator AtoC